MKQYRWFHGSGLGELITGTESNNITRHVGIPGSKIKPSRSYQDNDGSRIEISGFSSSEGGYLGIDKNGVFRVYNEHGQCVQLPSGHSNIDRVVNGQPMPRNPRYDLKV
jgi:hypothetical protein